MIWGCIWSSGELQCSRRGDAAWGCTNAGPELPTVGNAERGPELGAAAAVGDTLQKQDTFPNYGKHSGFRGYHVH